MSFGSSILPEHTRALSFASGRLPECGGAVPDAPAHGVPHALPGVPDHTAHELSDLPDARPDNSCSVLPPAHAAAHHLPGLSERARAVPDAAPAAVPLGAADSLPDAASHYVSGLPDG